MDSLKYSYIFLLKNIVKFTAGLFKSLNAHIHLLIQIFIQLCIHFWVWAHVWLCALHKHLGVWCMHRFQPPSVGSTTFWPFKIIGTNKLNIVVLFSLDTYNCHTPEELLFQSSITCGCISALSLEAEGLCERYFCHMSSERSLNGKICKICQITCNENRRTTRKATKGLTEISVGIPLVKCVMVRVGESYPNLCQVTQQHWEGTHCSPTARSICPAQPLKPRHTDTGGSQSPGAHTHKHKAHGNSFN